jgi:LuxR family maltose regulon positive regulatory protein
LPRPPAIESVTDVAATSEVRRRVPALPAATIARDRLHAALDAAHERRLTLVSAPAGWGKTVLLGSWSEAAEATWLTAGSRQLDGRAFAIRIERLMRAERPPLLVVDDAHLLHGAALEALRELLADDRARVVVAARHDPDLRLYRHRLGGELSELRAADLAFTEAEGAEVLAAMGCALRPDQVRRLVARTEGWAAGLRLAGLSLAGERDPEAFVAGFAGDDRAIADYLAGEVLDGRPAEEREFLLRTSVADRLDGDLARALTGQDDAPLMLERLAAAGMFLVPLDRRGGAYRYHALFRELLRSRLRLECPGAEAELHALAGAWFAERGDGAEAVAHAVAAGDAGGCDDLLAEHWRDLLLDGRSGSVAIAAAARRPDDARLAVAAAAGCLERGDRATAASLLSRAEAGGGETAAFAALLDARARGDAAAAWSAAASLIAPTPDAGAVATRALAHLELGSVEFECGSPEAASEQLEAAGALAAEVGSAWVELGHLGRAAALAAAAGRLVRAEQAARHALDLAEPKGHHRTVAAAWAYAALAAVHWHRDELWDAERRSDAAVAAAHSAGAGDALLAVRALRAHLAAARGDVELGSALLRAARADAPTAGPLVPRWLEVLGPAPWAPDVDDGPLAEAAAWLQRGDALAALRRVEALAECDPPPYPATALHARLLTALARHTLGRREESARALEQALEIACREGYKRPFLAGIPVRRLLERQQERATAYGPLVAELLDALQAREPPPAGPLEPLSERERAVLRLLPTLLSYREIGGELFVATNTVKTHVKSIYRKLDVASRRDAVARARALRLI